MTAGLTPNVGHRGRLSDGLGKLVVRAKSGPCNNPVSTRWVAQRDLQLGCIYTPGLDDDLDAGGALAGDRKIFGPLGRHAMSTASLAIENCDLRCIVRGAAGGYP